MHPTRRQLDELLTGIRAIVLPLDEFAAAGHHALTELHRRRQIYIDARVLPADPELLHAQRTGRYVPLPTGKGERLTDAWQEIAESSPRLWLAHPGWSATIPALQRPSPARSVPQLRSPPLRKRATHPVMRLPPARGKL